jgi:RHS repeat-associated protein
VTYNPGSGIRKDVTRYALGARGGDMAETALAMGSSGERTVRSYPLYDGHGNTVAQVARAEDDAPGGSFVAVPGAPAFELAARRKCGAWGQVRWSKGSPLDQGYCGNLQHRRDAESGLVYMRARYYEPWTGRFLSEDPAMDGANWYVYCANDPVNMFDPEGRKAKVGVFLLSVMLGFAINLLFTAWTGDPLMGMLINSVVAASPALFDDFWSKLGTGLEKALTATGRSASQAFAQAIKSIVSSYKRMADAIESLDDRSGGGRGGGAASVAIIAVCLYSGYLMAELFAMDIESLR